MNVLQSFALSATLAGLLTATSTAGDVLEVGPQRSFASVQAAVSAATNGDIVLIDPGTYAGDLDIDFGVTLVARTTAFTIDGYLDIGPLPGSQAVLVAGGVIQPTQVAIGFDGIRPIIDVESCRGAVRIQDCEVRATFTTVLAVDGGPALRCNRSNHVVCTSSLFTGTSGTPSLFVYANGGVGIDVSSESDVELDRCVVVGGRGALSENGGYGGAGVNVSTAGRLLCFGSSVTGGAGGDALSLFGGNGGPGLYVDSALSTAILQDTTLAGGLGGKAGFGTPGSNGPLFSGLPPTLLDGTPRSFDAPRIVRATDPGWALTTQGLDDLETAATWLSLRTAPRYAPVFERTLRIRASATDTVRLNPVAAAPMGEVAIQFGPTVPPVGEEGVVIWAQSFCAAPAGTPGGSLRFSGSRATVLLDAAFSGP